MKELINFNLSGNIVHSAWFRTIKTESGKADLIAINILAEIVYWYKPYEVRDEETGQHLGWKNKYKEDLLQKSYANLAEQFGLSERQVKAGIVRLEELGVITRVFRSINAKGVLLNNVLYIQLNIKQLKAISELPSDKISSEGGQKNVIGVTENCHTPNKKMSEGGQNFVTGVTENCHTNTEIITKTTTEITNKITTETTHINNKQSEIVCASSEAPGNMSAIIEKWNCNIYLPKIVKLSPGTTRYKMINVRIKDYGLEAVLQAIDNISQSDFLQGKKVGRNNKPFLITFDWFARPDNFPKVLEGNYSNQPIVQAGSHVVYQGEGCQVEESSTSNAFDRLRERRGGM